MDIVAINGLVIFMQVGWPNHNKKLLFTGVHTPPCKYGLVNV